jgi:DNA-binding GntR family transcriptional regulator
MPATPMHQQIADAIRSDIHNGTLKPGDRLPNKDEIAAKWKCSIQPVSTALMRLEHEGLVIRRQGVGTFVVDPSAS